MDQLVAVLLVGKVYNSVVDDWGRKGYTWGLVFLVLLVLGSLPLVQVVLGLALYLVWFLLVVLDCKLESVVGLLVQLVVAVLSHLFCRLVLLVLLVLAEGFQTAVVFQWVLWLVVLHLTVQVWV